MPLHISENQVKESLSYELAFSAVSEAHRSLSLGTSDNVTRTRARSSKMSLHSLSASSDELGLAAAKIYSATKEGVRSLILLYSTDSGELLATIDANELGRKRTVATCLVAAKLILEDDPKQICLFGAGYQATGIIEALNDLRLFPSCDTINVVARSKESASKFCDSFASSKGFELKARSAEDSLASAELIITATTSSKPLFRHTEHRKAKCICAIGSNSLARRELDPRTITAASKIVVDSIDVAKSEAGDLLSPTENGKIRWNQLKELGQCLIDTALAKANDDQLVIFCSQGLAVQDLYAAQKVYQQFLN